MLYRCHFCGYIYEISELSLDLEFCPNCKLLPNKNVVTIPATINYIRNLLKKLIIGFFIFLFLIITPNINQIILDYKQIDRTGIIHTIVIGIIGVTIMFFADIIKIYIKSYNHIPIVTIYLTCLLFFGSITSYIVYFFDPKEKDNLLLFLGLTLYFIIFWLEQLIILWLLIKKCNK